jgi:lipoate-protein ligase A
VEAVICRLLPWQVADGPTNMAVDEALVRTAAESGVASLRFYGWSPATLSLGYFQPASVRLGDPRLSVLPFVRRPSGGATLVHHHEVTYALALPPGPAWHKGGPWMPRMHQVIAAALADLGYTGRTRSVTSDATARHGDVLCFQQFTAGDLICAERKVVGSAQRKYHRALLQHGSILLATSEHTPALPGLRELTGIERSIEQVSAALARAFRRETGWTLQKEDWAQRELSDIRTLAREKYATSAWNERR